MAKKPSGDKYAQCLLDAMKAARYGTVRMADARAHYERMVDGYVAKGMGLNDARSGAMDEMMKRLEQSAAAKQNRVLATAKKLGEMRERIVETVALPTKGMLDRSMGARIYDALHGTVEDVAELKTARHNFTAEKDVALGNITSMFRGIMNDFSKNWLGMNRGTVAMADIADAVIGIGSPSQVAKDIATTLRKMYDYSYSELNLNGATIARVIGDELPAQPNAVRLEQMGLDAFKARYMNRIDWNKAGNGYFIRENERDAFLDSYYYAHVNETWGENQWDVNSKLDGIPRPYEQTGGQFARDFQNYTILKFKTGEDYADFHTQLMDGDFLSTVTRMMEKQAHNIALAKIWGPSPQYTAQAFRKMAEDAAKTYKPAGKSVSNLNRLLRRYDNIVNIAMKQNPMDGESRLGMFVQTTSNLMNSAMLHGALFSSVPGDFATMLGNRLHNNEPLIGAMTEYVKSFLSTKTARQDALAMGHIYSEYIGQITHSTHYNNGMAWGETATKIMADKTMKLNLMNRHFDAAIIADNKFRAISLFNGRQSSLENLRERFVLENNGITAAEWDKTRKAMDTHVFQPADDISMFRPLDHFDTLGTDLVHKWQRLFWNESRRSVYRASMEAQAIAMGGERADTLAGVLRKSTIAFQTYGITYGLALGRAIMHGSPGERLGAFARMGLSAVIAGAFAAQAKNLWYGRTPEPITELSFWVKAIGNAAGPWGAVITGGLRTDPASAVMKAVGGPYLTFVADLYARTAGSAFQFLDMGEGVSHWSGSKEGVLFVDALRKYAIPQTFYTALLLQRAILEPLQEAFDAGVMKKRYKAQIRRAKEVGTPFRPGYEPGSRTGILPGFGG